MTVKLPEKAGFAPTVQEWDALVRIAENLAAQVVQRDAESLKATFDAHEKINQLSGDLYGAQMALVQAHAERDAAKEWRDTFKSDLEAERARLKSALISAKSISDERYNAIHKYHDAVSERDAARAEVARLTAENDFLNGGAMADKQGIDILLAENERLTAVLTALINQADVAWATLDHTENEHFVSRLGDAIDNARMALRQPAPAQGQRQDASDNEIFGPAFAPRKAGGEARE